jgi:putative DNA primase/helicase
MTAIVQQDRIFGMGRLPLDAELRAKAIVEALGGIWRGSRGECRCPAHDDADPSLSVRLGNSAILFHCFAGCATGDVLKALNRLRLHDRDLLHMSPAKPKRDNRGLAMRLWVASRPITGTIAEDYLHARGLSGPFPRALRFNPTTVLGSGKAKRIMPAMIAAFENDLGVVAVQRTFLDPLNLLHKPMLKPKVSLGLLGTSAIRLAPATDELGLAEGIEDALTAMEWFGTPTWALGGVERLAFVDIPERVRRVIVYSDRGRAAERLLNKAHEHLTSNNRELITRVPELHNDWNDAWRAYREIER